jgi:hypothetical protein
MLIFSCPISSEEDRSVEDFIVGRPIIWAQASRSWMRVQTASALGPNTTQVFSHKARPMLFCAYSLANVVQSLLDQLGKDIDNTLIFYSKRAMED